MNYTRAQLYELNTVIGKFITETTKVSAMPGSVRNNGEDHDVLAVTIGVINEGKQEIHKKIYRGPMGGFESWLRERMNKLTKK